jgi:pimeloyl-ACP methyl ester carboxylesterase
VLPGLKAGGIVPHAICLPGHGRRGGEAGLDVDLHRHAGAVVDHVVDHDLRDIMLVGHSYGGMPVTQAWNQLRDRVASVVYVDAGVAADGQCQLDTRTAYICRLPTASAGHGPAGAGRGPLDLDVLSEVRQGWTATATPRRSAVPEAVATEGGRLGAESLGVALEQEPTFEPGVYRGFEPSEIGLPRRIQRP